MDDNKQIPDMEPVNGGSQETAAGDSHQWSRPSDDSEQKGETFEKEPSQPSSQWQDDGEYHQKNFHNYDNTPMPKQKIRRVGTVTLGIVLIVVGTLLIWALFDPSFSVATIAKFSPAILILVGAEMIVGYFRSDGNKVKYDCLSMVVCFLLIIGSLIGAMIPTVFQATVGWAQIEERLHNDVEDSIYEATKDLKTIDSIYVNVYRYSRWDGISDRASSYQKIMDDGNYRAHLHVNLRGDYENGTALAEDAKEIVDRIREVNIPLENVTFNYDGKQYSGSLELDGRYNLDLTVEEMAEKVRFEPIETAEDDSYEESYDMDSSYEAVG